MSAQAGEMTAPASRRSSSPPVLGFFREAIDGIQFHPTMEPGPSRVPHGRFASPVGARYDQGTLLGCRHGLVLIFQSSKDQLLVWDPITGGQRRVATPLGFDMQESPIDGAVLRAAAGDHFQVVLVGYKQEKKNPRAEACFYSSETGAWSNVVSARVPRNAMDHAGMPAVLVGGSLYWLLSGDGKSRLILQADLATQSLAVTPVPMDMFAKGQDLMLMLAEGGGLGLLSLSDYTVQLWKRGADCGRVASWVLGRTVELGSLLSLNSQKQSSIWMLGRKTMWLSSGQLPVSSWSSFTLRSSVNLLRTTTLLSFIHWKVCLMQVSRVTFRWLRSRSGAFSANQMEICPLFRMHRECCGVNL